MNQKDILNSFILAIISSGVLNAIVSHFLYSKKLKQENKYKANAIITKDIGKSLKKVRELELDLTKQEIYDAENEFLQRGSNVNFFEGECIYPEIFNDWKSYNDFHNQIQECRKNYEKFLSCKVALNIVFIDRYIMQLSLFMSENGGEEMLPTWGTLFIIDLHKWQKIMDRLLVKEINKHEYKLESHETIKWKIMRRRIIEKQYKKTILYYLITGNSDIKNRKRNKLIDEVVKEFKNKYIEESK